MTTGTGTTLDLNRIVAEGRVLPGTVGQWRVRATTLGGKGPWSDWQLLELGTPPERLNEDRFRVVLLGAQPVQGRLRVRYEVGLAQGVRLALYDALGRRVRVLHDGPLWPGGPYEAEADVSRLASGTYLLRLESHGPALQTDALSFTLVR